jgi:hypothetical protein
VPLIWPKLLEPNAVPGGLKTGWLPTLDAPSRNWMRCTASAMPVWLYFLKTGAFHYQRVPARRLTTLAPGTAPPLWSVTKPRTAAVYDDCAQPRAAIMVGKQRNLNT